MKTRFLLTIFLAAAAYIIFSSRSTGPGFNGLGDRTSSPVSSGNCSNCHSGGSFGASVTITLRDQSNNIVTSYVAGQPYILEFDVNNSSGTPGGFGGQAVALTSTNANAGTMGTTISTNTRTVTISGRSYVEHNSISANGIFRVNWTAPASGTGTVRIFASGLAVNANGGTSGDQVATANIQITEQVPTTISYSQSTYCQNTTNPTPTITGTTGGSFSAGAGLSINSSSGQINLAASTPGTYTVTYNFGGGSTTASVTVTAQDAATLSYGANTSFCASQGSAVSPTVTGVQTGTFSVVPSGLNINSTTGVITPSASIAGNYVVSYTTNGPCPRTVTSNISITAQDAATLSYGANSSFCNSQSSTVSPTVTGVTTGTFSASAGLTINTSTGAITPSSSTPGTYTVSYTTNGSCPRTVTSNISIVNSDVASISYGNSPSFCSGQTSLQSPTITGVQSGTFSSASGLSINASNGAVNPAASTVGSYSVRYITSGSCPDTAISTVNILQNDNANFSYNGSAFCVSGTDPQPTTPTSPGIFSSTSGLGLSASTGLIFLSISTPGNYTVTYTTFGSCPDTASVNIQILSAGNADFNYAAASFCSNATNPQPTINGIAGGVFSATNGLSINSSSGVVNLSASTPGTYTVNYNVSGSCPASDTTSLTILQSDAANISYATANATFNSSIQDTVYAFICTNPIPAPLVFGTQGGTFTTDESGVILNSVTGEISMPISDLNFGPSAFVYTTAGACPTTDSFWVSSTCATAIANISDEIKLYPNPSFDGNFTLESNFDGAAEIEIYNLLGAKVQSQSIKLAPGKNTLRLKEDLAKGDYLLFVNLAKERRMFRISYR
jgi:hypothetical protein